MPITRQSHANHTPILNRGAMPPMTDTSTDSSTNSSTAVALSQRVRGIWQRSSVLARAVLVPSAVAGVALVGYGLHVLTPGHGFRLALAMLMGVAIGSLPYSIIREMRESETGDLDSADWLRFAGVGALLLGTSATRVLAHLTHGGGYVLAGVAAVVASGVLFVGLPSVQEAEAARVALRARVHALADKRATRSREGNAPRD